jgi:hypothetical protein
MQTIAFAVTLKYNGINTVGSQLQLCGLEGAEVSIFEAVENNDVAAAAELLQTNPDDVHHRDSFNRTPIRRASSWQMVDLLRRHGATENPPGWLDTLRVLEAGMRGGVKGVQTAPVAGVNISTPPDKRLSPEIEGRLAMLRTAIGQVNWCDAPRFSLENLPGVCPGDHLNRFGWYVIGTTVGGNAIVVRADDPAVYFADHTWYGDEGIHYQDLAGDGRWRTLPLTAEGVRESLLKLAESVDDFMDRFFSEIDALLYRVG